MFFHFRGLGGKSWGLLRSGRRNMGFLGLEGEKEKNILDFLGSFTLI